jgi:crossover junction endodeoxyribonuclease RuvC
MQSKRSMLVSKKQARKEVSNGFYLWQDKCRDYQMKNDKIILGIDPGTNVMGYGAIHLLGKEIKLLGAGIISLQKIKDHSVKLKRIFEGTIEIIEQFHPDEVAIEAPFFGKNVQSMLKLGRAQGIAIAASLIRDIPIAEYSPKKIKHSITGNGNASKQQVASMLQKLLSIKNLPHYLDATDALGAAMCHYFQCNLHTIQNGSEAGKKKFTGWKAFLAENPERKISAGKKL